MTTKVQVRTFATPSPLAQRLVVTPTALDPSAAAPTPTPSPTPTPTLRASRRSIEPSRNGNGNKPPAQMPVYRDRPNEGGITFANQDSLPRLPIPPLESTCERYLSALRPLQSSREHAETRQAVQEFLKHDGPELQERLKRYASDRTSYIEQFWYDSYLNFDNPVVLNLNPFFLLEDDPTPARNNQVTRAASLVVSALEFVRAVRREELPPDTVRGRTLCMNQYRRLFGTARVPTESGCHIEEDPSSKHIIVLCHGQFYYFDVLDDNSDVIMTEKDICLNLQTIIDDASQAPIQEAAKSALGVLSTENRKVWSGLREVIMREEGSNNADCLAIVDTALFVLCLDYTEPATSADLCQNMLCGTSVVEKGVQTGTCTNRWYDKLQIIVCRNGSAGINFEHTGVDGHTVLRMTSDVYTDTILRFARTINGQAPTLWATTSPDPSRRHRDSFVDVNTTPHKLEWDMTPELQIAVRFAETRLADLIEQNEFRCLDFSAYGKLFITSMGLSPDAFVQMAFQAAYYGLYGRVECTYEPALTKFFLHGRTEAIRSVSEASVNFVQTFWADNPAEHKADALRAACKRHADSTRDSARGEGCDRHLYALLCTWQKSIDDEAASVTSSISNNHSSNNNSGSGSGSGSVTLQQPELTALTSAPAAPTAPVSAPSPTPSGGRSRGESVASRAGAAGSSTLPPIFADAGWDRLNTTILSTSNCGNPSLRQFGFGPASGDGFGIGYIIKDDSISICVSSRHRQTRRFVDTLESYLLEVRRVLRLAAARSRLAQPVALPSALQSRIREAATPQSRFKSRGRLVTADSFKSQRSATGTVSPGEESTAMTEDDELGGYGFFDAGMLLQALRARGDMTDGGEPRPSERAAVQLRRRDVGKKLRLIDY